MDKHEISRMRGVERAARKITTEIIDRFCVGKRKGQQERLKLDKKKNFPSGAMEKGTQIQGLGAWALESDRLSLSPTPSLHDFRQAWEMGVIIEPTSSCHCEN